MVQIPKPFKKNLLSIISLRNVNNSVNILLKAKVRTSKAVAMYFIKLQLLQYRPF